MALGMLAATGKLRADLLRDSATVGEVALDGSVKPVNGGKGGEESRRCFAAIVRFMSQPGRLLIVVIMQSGKATGDSRRP